MSFVGTFPLPSDVTLEEGSFVALVVDPDSVDRAGIQLRSKDISIRDCIAIFLEESTYFCLLGMKENPDTFHETVVKGKSNLLDIDDSRIPIASEDVDVKGRYPTNCMLDSFYCISLDEQSFNMGIHGAGGARSGSSYSSTTKENMFGVQHDTKDMHRFGDEGGASRFFHKIDTEDELIEHLEVLLGVNNGYSSESSEG